MTLRKGEYTVNRTVWRTGFGRGCGPAARQTTETEGKKERKQWMHGFLPKLVAKRVNDILRNICCLTEACGELTL